MSDIFISYAREDREKARRLAEALGRQGWSVWWDRRIPAGRSFDDVIDEALEAARCVVVLWSIHSIGSHWVKTEAGEGLERNILVPVFLEQVKVPLAFRRIQTANLAGWQDDEDAPAFRQLVADIRAVLGPAGARAGGEKARDEQSGTGGGRTISTTRETPGSEFHDSLKDGGEGPLMVVIPAGEFAMGSSDSEKGRRSDEGPQHRVVIASPFALGKYPVTVREFRGFAEASGYRTEAEKENFSWVWQKINWEKTKGVNWRYDQSGAKAADALPVIHVSWNDALAYTEWLKNQSGRPYRLPTEAEWEYACRAGTTTRFYPGDQEEDLARAGWYFGNSGGKLHPVGEKEPNGFSLCDMHGNVWEWVEDDWHENYQGAPTDGGAWIDAPRGAYRVVRGGGWYDGAAGCRSAIRYGFWPVFRFGYLGFRLARSVSLGP